MVLILLNALHERKKQEKRKKTKKKEERINVTLEVNIRIMIIEINAKCTPKYLQNSILICPPTIVRPI